MIWKIETELNRKLNPFLIIFLGFDTTVHFISEEELKEKHSKMPPHGGCVICTGITNNKHKQVMEFNLSLENNPEFASSVLVAFARAVYKLSIEGKKKVLLPYLIFLYPIFHLNLEKS